MVYGRGTKHFRLSERQSYLQSLNLIIFSHQILPRQTALSATQWHIALECFAYGSVFNKKSEYNGLLTWQLKSTDQLSLSSPLSAQSELKDSTDVTKRWRSNRIIIPTAINRLVISVDVLSQGLKDEDHQNLNLSLLLLFAIVGSNHRKIIVPVDLHYQWHLIHDSGSCPGSPIR